MKASACTFDQMMTIRSGMPMLADRTSWMQVEYGLDELKASWHGFIDITDDCNMEFKTRKQVCAEFSDALTEYIDYLTEPVPNEMGH
jgi:hypothetical protein